MATTIQVTTGVFQALLHASLLKAIEPNTTPGVDWTTWGYDNAHNDLITVTLIDGEQVKQVRRSLVPEHQQD